MTTLGTPLSPSATRVLLLGSGELGKEVAIELQRFGVEVIAADRYADAPAMQVAHRSQVLDMLDPQALRALIAREQPHLIVPEIEAIHTETLLALEREQSPGCRNAGPADLAVSLRRHGCRVSRGDRRGGPAVRGQAGDVVLGQGPEHPAQRGGHRCCLGLRADRRTCRCRPLHRRGLIDFDSRSPC
ncbi:phosphoribosylglycinamide formyltransferase 2 [Xanthomonas arboricola pv. pruni str. MAFF 311562]|uniref:Phosphoribosylglycinamide formyltransferase 2 n=1 Tax=Xanthomonas arboricola pv. pruni str. MAFF 311562 TaxID=1414836 RepID=W4RZV6_9XANT|nr:phosphoribosylglycinamide formyltransferase 2 [Xanthomonas arboricola pv. pruni str. MAFF 311562]